MFLSYINQILNNQIIFNNLVTYNLFCIKNNKTAESLIFIKDQLTLILNAIAVRFLISSTVFFILKIIFEYLFTSRFYHIEIYSKNRMLSYNKIFHLPVFGIFRLINVVKILRFISFII